MNDMLSYESLVTKAISTYLLLLLHNNIVPTQTLFHFITSDHIITFGVGGNDGGSKEQESAIDTPAYSPPPSVFRP